MDTMKKALSLALIIFLTSAGAEGNRERPEIGGVYFSGNQVYSSSRLRKMMVSRKSGLFKKRLYFPRVLEDDIETIRAFYRSRGYLAAEVEKEIHRDEEQNRVEIKISIREGERFNFSGIYFLGNDFYPDRKLMEQLDFDTGDYFSQREVQNAAAGIMSLYTDNGFSDAEVTTDLDINYTLNTVSLDFFIQERNRYKINRIIIKGNHKTRDAVIKREITFKEDQYINFSKMFDSRQNILRSGLFRSVFINHVPVEDSAENRKDIVVQVDERDSIEIGVSAGYDSREYFWQKAEISNRNIRGTSRSGGISLRRSALSREAQATLSSPRTFSLPVKTDISLFNRHLDEPGYKVIEAGAGVSAGKSFNEIVTLSLSYDYRSSIFRNLDREEDFDLRRLKKQIITLLLTYDSRDSYIYPSRGKYASLKNELFTGDISFLRSSAQARIFYPLSGRLVAASAVRGAAIFTSLSASALPPDERLYTGGPYSVRGFKYQTLGPSRSRGRPSGGKAKFVWNIAELRFNFYRSLGITAFADTGKVWETLNRADISDLRTSAGAGLAAALPFGVFRLEYAVNLDPRKEEKEGILFFGSGTAF